MTAAPEQQTFSFFEDVEVHDYRIRLMNTGDGLSPSMASDKELHMFDEVYILIKGSVKRVSFDGDPESRTADRIGVVRAETACIVPESFAGAKIRAQEKRDTDHAEEVAETKRLAREKRNAERKAERARFKIMESDDEPDGDDEPDDDPPF